MTDRIVLRLVGSIVALGALVVVAGCGAASNGGGAGPGSTLSAPATTLAARQTSDRADDVTGYQIHALYVVPSDGSDRRDDTDGAIANSLSAFNTWLARQTGKARLRIDTYRGAPDVTFVRLPETDATIAARGAFVREEIEGQLHTLGFNAPKKIYAAYYDGSSTQSCGGGAWPPKIIGNVAAMYLQGTPPGAAPCNTNPVGANPSVPGYIDFSMLHEIIHTLGIVATCAPHHTRAGHVSGDDRDLMWAGDPPRHWQPGVLDVGHDDYYDANIPGCLDLARTAFFDPLPVAAVAPPGWP